METYWAADKDSKKAAAAVENKIKRFREELELTGRAELMRRSWRAFQGRSPDGNKSSSRIGTGGKNAELKVASTNHYASVVRQSVNMVTSHQPKYTTVAVNTDSSSMSDASLGEGLISFYEAKRKWKERDNEAILSAVVLLEGFTSLTWDATAGQKYSDGQRTMAEGDVDYLSHTLFDLAFDTRAQDFDELEWIVFRRFVNKWNLAKTYPEHAEKIINQTLDGSMFAAGFNDLSLSQSISRSEEMVELWEFRHIPTPACANGRLMLFLAGGLVIHDSMGVEMEGQRMDAGYPYGQSLSVFRVIPEKIPGTMYGHSEAVDCLGLQELIDLGVTIMTTAVSVGGMANYYVPDGSSVKSEQIGGGLRLLRGNSSAAPIALDTVKVSPEVISLTQMAIQFMRQQMSLNDVIMGDVPKGMPAQGMALMAATALQAKTRLQGSFHRMLEDSRTGLFQMLKRFAKSERVALIAGQANSWKVARFTADDLQPIESVKIEPVDPMLKTMQGRTTLADSLLERGVIDARQYLSMIKSGNIDSMLEGDEANLARIRATKELLRKGTGLPPIDREASMPSPENPVGAIKFEPGAKGYVVPLISDTHWLDIPEFLSVIATPEARDNPDIVKAVLDVVSYQADLWRQMDPIFMVNRGGMPPPPKGMPPSAAEPDPAANGQPPKQEDGMPQPKIENPGLEANMSGASMPRQPKLPKNPVTGEAPEMS